MEGGGVARDLRQGGTGGAGAARAERVGDAARGGGSPGASPTWSVVVTRLRPPTQHLCSRTATRSDVLDLLTAYQHGDL